MIKQLLITLLLLSGSAAFFTPAYSADKPIVYGSQLMTEQERNEHRQRMQNAKNDQEREKLRKEHHERMKVRAKEQGVELPDKPPMRGYQNKGAGQGMGAGAGGGKGGGKGGGM